MGFGRLLARAPPPRKMVQIGLMVMFKSLGSMGGWTRGPITTPGLTAEMENLG